MKWKFARGCGLIGLSLVLGMMVPGWLWSMELYSNDSIRLSLDSTVSWGIQMRVADRDDDLICIQEKGGKAATANSDDGNLNYDQGDIISNIAKINTELSLQSQHWGVFLRGLAFYDYEVMQGDRDRTDLSDTAEDEIGRDAELLDAYVWGQYTLGSMPISLRFGRQVISWGESTFIPNSINTINPIDVAKIRAPGSELKEALMPLAALYGSIGLTENISLEGFYLFEWDEYEIDPAGTYFSTNDWVSPGGYKLMPGYGAYADMGDASTADTPMAIPRSKTRDADDDGQFGFALRVMVPPLNDTEFSLYYINYHSQLPYACVNTASLPGLMEAAGGNMDGFWKSVDYYAVYPEDIELYGFAFNTMVGDFALQGEISHRRDMPLQIDGSEMFFAVLSPLNPAFAMFNQIGDYSSRFDEDMLGYIEKDVTQAQMTFTRLIGPALGADQWVVLGEVGFLHVHDMPDTDDLRILAAGVQTSGNAILGPVAHPHAAIESSGAFADADSWGYRLLVKPTFNNVFMDVNLSPRLAWSHDVDGNSPQPFGPFLEDRKAITLGLEAEYHFNLVFDLSYTNYFGAGKYNQVNDRDFVAFNVKYSF